MSAHLHSFHADVHSLYDGALSHGESERTLAVEVLVKHFAIWKRSLVQNLGFLATGRLRTLAHNSLLIFHPLSLFFVDPLLCLHFDLLFFLGRITIVDFFFFAPPTFLFGLCLFPQPFLLLFVGFFRGLFCCCLGRGRFLANCCCGFIIGRPIVLLIIFPLLFTGTGFGFNEFWGGFFFLLLNVLFFLQHFDFRFPIFVQVHFLAL
mmetsp:Transcript_13628/g.20259  ORF Transcript_13628/g.20259 Transcript_13628/m.20259 type:complete len:206 (+) Transcript_13628:136-753(+)